MTKSALVAFLQEATHSLPCSITFAAHVNAGKVEILTMPTFRTLSATFGFPVSAWFAGMSDTILIIYRQPFSRNFFLAPPV